MSELAPRFAVCLEPRFNEALPAYSFGDLERGEREAVALHLVACDVCWGEFKRLEAVVGALRADRPVTAPVEKAAALLFHLGEKNGRVFGGHVEFVAAVSLLHASMYLAALWTELVYAFDRFGGVAVVASPWIFIVTLMATVGVLGIECRGSQNERRRGLESSGAALGVFITLTLAALGWVLPHDIVLRASITTRTAFVGYAKTVFVHFVPTVVVFVLVPLQAVMGLDREVREGRAANTAALLSGDRSAFHPRGTWYVAPATIGWLFVVLLLACVIGGNYLLDHVDPGPYTSWFAVTLYTRTGLELALAVLGWAWYTRRIHDLKQMALLLRHLQLPGVERRA